jgi:hypothetical protein
MRTSTKKWCAILSLLTTFLLVLSHSSCFCEAKTKTKKKVVLHEEHKDMCRGLPTISRKHEKSLQWLFNTIGEFKIVSSTPQNEAACWMFRQGKSVSPQRYALAVIYYSSKGDQWEINTNWMTMKNECTWYGVRCNVFKTIVELDIAYIELKGLIPRELFLLSQVQDLDLHGNDLQGT